MLTACYVARNESNRVVAIFANWDDALNFATSSQILDCHPVDLEEYDCPELTPCEGCSYDEGDGTQTCRLCLACRALVNYTNHETRKETRK